jgi:hypothetical protein
VIEKGLAAGEGPSPRICGSAGPRCAWAFATATTNAIATAYDDNGDFFTGNLFESGVLPTQRHDAARPRTNGHRAREASPDRGSSICTTGCGASCVEDFVRETGSR